MTRTIVRSLAALGAVLVLGSCETQGPSGPRSGKVANVALAPTFSDDALALQTTALPINRIRLTAKQVPEGTVLDQEVITVNPNDAEWQLDFSIPLPTGPDVTIVVSIELINETGGVQTVQWSGVTEPFVLTAGPVGAPVDVEVFRGPLENLGVTSVTITPASATVEEGATTALAANVGGGGAGTQVFWTALDPQTATVNGDGVVTGVLPGTARIVATAGAHSDTITVVVSVRVATIAVSPPAVTLPSVGATQAFTARALDPRGAEVTGVTITFSVAPTTVATHQGNGVMRAVANGVATVSATGRGVTGTAQLTVQQVAASVVVTPPTAAIQNVGGTTTFTAQVRDANGNPMTANVTWESTPTNVATVGAATGVVTGTGNGTATITARVNATVFGTATVTVGSQVFFTDGFEGAFNWVVDGIANRTNGVGIRNTAVPEYVTLPGNDASNGSLPTAPQGAFYLWFGYPNQGNYLGEQDIEFEFPKSGGFGIDPQMGSALSPAFAIPGTTPNVILSFRSWFEIEGIDPAGHDLMRVEVIDNANGALLATITLNSPLSPTGSQDLPTTSGGAGVAPTVRLETLQVTGVGGRSIRIRFTFETIDELFNGFRGWIIDDVRVGTTAPAAGPGAVGGTIVPMQLCQTGACVRASPPVRTLRRGN